MRRGIVLAAVLLAQKHGFTKNMLPLKQIVDTSFLEAAARAVAE